ncbi:MAG: acylase [Halioglobus sp.]
MALAVGCGDDGPEFDRTAHLQLGEQYDVVIERDRWGVPHIDGVTDNDAAFGFAYAQSQDNWELVQDSIAIYRGTQAKYKGRDAAVVDYLVHWLGIWGDLDARYDTDLTPATRAFLEAFADGVNYYGALHPDVVNPELLPVTGKDIVAGYMLRHVLFYGFDAVMRELTQDTRQREISTGPGVVMNGVPVGSNAFAIAPSFSEEGATRLAINSHQPATGPVAWYEAHIKSGEGLDVMGGLFAGSPTIGVGFTKTTAWGVTVNKPDLVDVYVLDIDPDDSMRYRLDGQWHTLEQREVKLDVLLFGFLPWSVTEVALSSKHGPVLETDHGTYAVRYAGRGEVRQVEQWLAMNKASNLEEWMSAMRMHAFASFNFVYADVEGNILFLHNSMTPERLPGFDWSQYLPGDRSDLIWQSYLPFEQLPQIVNPTSGWVLSANQSPFHVTSEEDNPDISGYTQEQGFPTRMTNRAYRGLQLFEELGPLSAAEFSRIKHDKQYSQRSRSYAYVQQALALELNESDPAHYREAQSVLAKWNFDTTVDNRQAALGTCIIAAEWSAEQAGKPAPPVRDELIRCADVLIEATGRLDPEWGEVNRHVRGDINVAVGGGPDTLRAIYGRGIEEDGFHTNVAGDGLYYLVSWSSAGEQTIEGTHQFGSATLDVESPHYADQAMLYAQEQLHDPLFDAAKRAGQVSQRYRPGEEIARTEGESD